MKKITKDLSFWDVFSNEFLNKVYDRFEVFVNQPVISSPFYKDLMEEVLVGLELENAIKILSNHGLASFSSAESISRALESHTYAIWFPMKSLEGHEFTFKEKAVLSSWALKQVEDKLSFMSLEDVISQTLATISPETIEASFQFCMSHITKHYLEATHVR